MLKHPLVRSKLTSRIVPPQETRRGVGASDRLPAGKIPTWELALQRNTGIERGAIVLMHMMKWFVASSPRFVDEKPNDG